MAGLAVSIYDDARLATLILRDRQVIALGPDDLEAQAAMLLEAAARLRAQMRTGPEGPV